MSKSTGIKPSQEMEKFMSEVIERQRRRLFELAKESKLVPPFIEEVFDFYGERFYSKLWELDENSELRPREDKSPYTAGQTKIWPYAMKLTDIPGILGSAWR